MAKPVYGTGVIFSMLVGETFIPMLCAQEYTYECLTEKIEKTGPTSGGVRQKTRRLEEHISTITGLTEVENTDSTLSFFHLLTVGIRRDDQEFRLVFEDGNGNEATVQGAGIFGDMRIRSPHDEYSECFLEILWNEDPDFTVIPPPGLAQVQDPLYLTLNAGALTVSDVLLTDPTVEILEVTLEGTQHDVILAGTVGNREVKFTNGTGTLTFEYSEVVDRGVYVLYQTS